MHGHIYHPVPARGKPVILRLQCLGALLCSLQQMIFAEWEGDLCLFGLLQPMQEDDLRAHAGNLLRKSKCELDTFTRRFLQRFDTIDKLNAVLLG